MARKPNDCRWLDRYMDCCRNTATHPNSWITPNGDAIFLEPECLSCAGCGYEPTTPETPAWDDEGRLTMAEHSPLPWRVSESPNGGGSYFIEHAGGYFVADVFHDADAALIVEAVNERDRLRDIVRRLAEYIHHSVYDGDGPLEIDITSSDSRCCYHCNANALLREAHEALGEVKP